MLKPILSMAASGLLGAVLLAQPTPRRTAATTTSDDPTPRYRQLLVELDVKKQIIRTPNGLLKFDYLVPSGPYHQLFDWDAYFMGLSLTYDRQAKYLASSVRNFLEYAGPPTGGRNGYTPRIIAPEGFWSLPEMCKPFLAQMTYAAAESMQNYWWVREYYDRLARTLYFWENSRQTPDGLFVWFNGDESGVDNNPAVSWEPSEITESVDLVAYLVREYRAMSLIAAALDRKDDVGRWRAKADALQKRLNDQMWSEADGLYFNIDRRTGQMVKIRTWTAFVPLWAALVPADRARRLIQDHLLNEKEFWSPYGLRTLAATEPAYNPKSGYWKGPVWVVSSYMMSHGLARYGYRDRAIEEAIRVTRLLVEDIERTGGMNENYNPETGAPAANTNFVSWNLLAAHWVDELRQGRDPAEVR